MKKESSAVQTELLLRMIDEAYEKKAWHGPNLRGSLRGITFRRAAWRPSPARHNIWEIVLHAAYWKYAVRRRLLGEKRGSFPLQGSNWFARHAAPTEQAWREDLALLRREHLRMRETIVQLSRGAARAKKADTLQRLLLLARGIAMHDVYHAGQIQLLKRLQK